MSSRFHIYVENKPGVERAYAITEEAVRSALGPRAETVEVTVRQADDPDLHALSLADFLVGAGFDTTRVGAYGKRLRLVHCTSAGVEAYLPLDWLPSGAVFTNSSGVHAEKGGAYGAMAVLMLNEQVPRHASNQRARLWDSALSTGIAGKTVLIHGFGSLGEAIAERLKPFGVRIVGTRRSGEPHPLADRIALPGDLDRLLPHADFLVVSCPLTAETRGQIGARQFALLPGGAGVLNISRGAVIDSRALAAALSSGHLSGAVVDVVDVEPLPSGSFWWDIPNLIITPHTSCDDPANYITKCLAIFAENVGSVLDGSRPRNIVQSELGY